MADFQKNRNLNRFLHSKLFLAVLFCIVILLGFSVVDIYVKSRETVKNRDFSLQKLEGLQKQEKDLTDQIAKLNSDQGIENELRDRYGVVKEGENLMVIVDEKNKEPLNAENSSGGFLSFLRNLLRP